MELSRSPSIPRFRPNLQKIGVKHIALQFDIRRRRIALTYFIWFRPSNVMEHTPPLNSAVVPLPVVGLDQTRRAKLDHNIGGVTDNNGNSFRFALAIRQRALGLTKKHKFISPNDDRKRRSSRKKQSQ